MFDRKFVVCLSLNVSAHDDASHKHDNSSIAYVSNTATILLASSQDIKSRNDNAPVI